MMRSALIYGATIAAEATNGVSGAEMDALVEKMESMRVSYGNPLYRLPLTFMEIFPVGLVIALISGAILRKSEVLPASAWTHQAFDVM